MSKFLEAVLGDTVLIGFGIFLVYFLAVNDDLINIYEALFICGLGIVLLCCWLGTLGSWLQSKFPRIVGTGFFFVCSSLVLAVVSGIIIAVSIGGIIVGNLAQ